MPKTYEMFWDCGFCGTEKLLGKTHRHCPGCGAVQDPTKRYFPPEDEKVAVEDHSFVGVDQKCGSCDTPNSAISDYCTNCGVPLEEAEAIDKVDEVDEGRQAGKQGGVVDSPPEPEGTSGATKAAAAGGLASTGCMLGCGGLVLVFAILCAINIFWTSEVTARVTGHSWERSITIEKLKTVRDDDWCSDLPRGAVERGRTSKEKSTKRVKDGETCKTTNVDNGDGTFKKKKKCSPKYKTKSIDADWCSYEVEAWKVQRTASETGGLADTPKWPTAKVDGCKRLGCSRQGKRRESFTVQFMLEGGARDSCDLPKSRWQSMSVGSQWTSSQRILSSDLVCSDLTRAD